MYLPDYAIADLCGDNFPKTWAPSGGENAGRQFVIENAGPLISNFDPAYLGPASYDIQVGLNFASPSPLTAFITLAGARVRMAGHRSDEVIGDREIRHEGEGIEVVLEPGQAVLCHSVEYVRVPPSLYAALSMRSSFARDWLDHSAADSIWPGFQGQITFELRNNGPRPYTLRSGMRPVQLAFGMMGGVPSRPYSGIYQQQEAQLHSRMEKDVKSLT